MEHLIDKDALVVEIEKLLYDLRPNWYEYDYDAAKAELLEKLLTFIHSLEVKEMDLEHEVESYWKQCDMTWCRDAYSMTHIRSMLSDIAKHFFELGLKAKGE